MCEWQGGRYHRMHRYVLNGRVEGIDPCIAPLVKVLNDGGFPTVASCCGHGFRPGSIALADGRRLIIAPDVETAERVERAFPPLGTVTECKICGATGPCPCSDYIRAGIDPRPGRW